MSRQSKRVGARIVAGGIAAALAAAAGAYLLYASPGSRQRRTKLRGWMLKFKSEVVEGLKRSKEWNRGAFERVVDAAHKKYSALKEIDPDELRALANEIKKQWATLSKAFAGTSVRRRGKRSS